MFSSSPLGLKMEIPLQTVCHCMFGYGKLAGLYNKGPFGRYYNA